MIEQIFLKKSVSLRFLFPGKYFQVCYFKTQYKLDKRKY